MRAVRRARASWNMLLSPAFSSIVTTCARATLVHTTQGTWYSLSAVSQSTAPGVAVKLASGNMRAYASLTSALHLFVSPQSSVHMKVCWMARSGSMPAAAREASPSVGLVAAGCREGGAWGSAGHEGEGRRGAPIASSR